MRTLAGQAEQSGVLRWFRHMERIEEDQLVKRMVISDVRGVSLRGRPRMDWMDSVKVCGARTDDCVLEVNS